MRKIFGLLLFVALTCCPVYAAGFYKWRDVNGVMHITDHLPDEAVEAEVDSETRINRSPMGDLGFGSQVQVLEQGHLQGQVSGERKQGPPRHDQQFGIRDQLSGKPEAHGPVNGKGWA